MTKMDRRAVIGDMMDKGEGEVGWCAGSLLVIICEMCVRIGI